MADPEIVWRPHPGSQALFLACPVFEALYEGTRGPGKTDGLLMDFAQHVGQGYGEYWRGILFRRTYKQLDEVIAKGKRWFPRIFRGARFLQSQSSLKWVFPDGEELLFRHMAKPGDYAEYHGHEYPWIAFEELTTWPNLDCYHVMKACCRSAHPGMPRRYRATTNPWGPGHNAVKAYFIDPAPPGAIVADDEGNRRVRIRGHWSENTALLEADPDYPARIAAAATNDQQRKAWLEGDWDIVAGGMFDDVWSRERHVLPVFHVPASWRISRAYDWGSTRPFSVGWWAEANGEAAKLPDGMVFCPPRGSLVRVAEWYGWDGRNPNVGLRMTDSEIGRGIIRREKAMRIYGRVHPGPADSTIFSADPGQTSPAEAMAAVGASFVPADKSSGSRHRGWEAMRRMLSEARKPRPEDPGMWVTEACTQFIRTIPTLPRSERDPDDVDTEAEDHCGDEARYRVLALPPALVGFSTVSL